jgi:hypothetical protein
MLHTLLLQKISHLKAIVGMQQSLVLWRTNNPWNIFISIVGTPAHISKLHTNNGVSLLFASFGKVIVRHNKALCCGVSTIH